jgi:hypothetical protein
VNLLAEQEATTMLNLLLEIHDRLGLAHHDDPETEQLREPTEIDAVLDEMDQREGSDRPAGSR